MFKEDAIKLKAEHRIVLKALEVANIAHERVVTVGEVVKALSLHERDARRIKRAYSSPFSITVAKIFAQLCARDVIFSPGLIGRTRYYGSEKALPAELRSLPSLSSRRRLVLQLVRNTVFDLGRAVRTGEVPDYAARHPEECNISAELITCDILTLKATGDLQLVGITLRKDNEGKNYYLPPDLSSTEFATRGPLTWAEQVASSFMELWEERTREAAASNRLPRPVSSAELRGHMMAVPQPHPNLRKRMYLVNTLTQLTLTSKAVVRKIRRPGQRAILWVPVDVPDEQIDLGDIFVSDAERVGEAVARAVRRLGRPVSIKDVRAEVKLDPTLRLARADRLGNMVSDIYKPRGRDHSQGRTSQHSRRLTRIYRVGRVDNDTYYYDKAAGLEDAKFFVQFEQVKRRWSACGAVEQMTLFSGCTYPSIAFGRALMIESDAKRTRLHLERLLKSKHGPPEVRGAAETLLDHVRDVDSHIQSWLKDSPRLTLQYPSEINSMPQTWTAAELHAFLKPFYPAARRIANPNNFLALVSDRIRRVPNPNFRFRFSNKSDETADYLFDRTDALLYTARKWGGHECYFQASLAAFNLGHLRDVRFVLPLLSMSKFEDRLAGVASLAFLQTKQAKESLRGAAVRDSSPTVREAALWGCGFAEGGEANDLFERCRKRDPDARLREFGKIAQEFATLDWWSYSGVNIPGYVLVNDGPESAIRMRSTS